MTLGAAGRALLVVFTAVIIQLTIGTDLRIGTATRDSLAAAHHRRRGRRARARCDHGIRRGIAADLFVPAPFGISAWWGAPSALWSGSWRRAASAR